MKSIVVGCAAVVLGLSGALVAYAYHGDVENLEVAATIKPQECPLAVQKTLLREARGGKIESVDLGTVDLEVAFMAHTTIDGKTYLIHVAADGRLVSKTLDEEDEVGEDVEFSKCPPAVQKTLAREADGAAIKTVTKSTSEGRPVYGATVKIGDDSYDLSVTAEGLLISKETSEEFEDDAPAP